MAKTEDHAGRITIANMESDGPLIKASLMVYCSCGKWEQTFPTGASVSEISTAHMNHAFQAALKPLTDLFTSFAEFTKTQGDTES